MVRPVYTKEFVDDLKKTLASDEVITALPKDSLDEILEMVWDELCEDIVRGVVMEKMEEWRPKAKRRGKAAVASDAGEKVFDPDALFEKDESSKSKVKSFDVRRKKMS